MSVDLWQMWLRPKRQLLGFEYFIILYISKLLLLKINDQQSSQSGIKFSSKNLQCDSKSMINIWKYIRLIGKIIANSVFYKKVHFLCQSINWLSIVLLIYDFDYCLTGLITAIFFWNSLQQQQHQKIISNPVIKLNPRQSPSKPPVLAM